MLKLIKKGFFYTFSIGAESLIALALLPILTTALSPHDYGIWTVLFSFAVFLRPALNLMFQDILRMKYFNSTQQQILFLIKSSIYVPVLFGLVLTPFSFLSSLEQWLHFPSAHIWKIVLFSVLHGFYYVILALIQFKERPGFFLAQQIIQTVVTIVATLVFLKFNLTWLAPVYARSLALFINCLIGFAWICENYGNPIKVEIPKNIFREYLIIGLKFLPVGIAPAIIPFTDRLLVSHLVGVEETSYLGIGGLFSSAVIIVATGFIYAWQPILYKKINSKTEDGSITYYSILYFLFLPLVGIMLAVIAMFVAPYIMKYDLSLVKPYIICLTIATVAECYYQHNYVMLKGMQRANILSLLAILLMPLNAGLVYYFVSNLGGLGAAWGTALSYLILTLISGVLIIFSNKKVSLCNQ